MATSNIDRFDQFTGKVFATLYEAFPMPVNLDIKPFTRVIAVDPIDTPEGEQQIVESDEFFEASIEWLKLSGYLTFGQQASSPTKFYGCVLTAKGLEVLKAMPGTLKGESLGAKLQEAAKSGMTETVKDLVGKALGAGASLTYGAVSSMLT